MAERPDANSSALASPRASGLRRALRLGLKVAATVVVFYLLLTHPVSAAGETARPVWQVVRDHLHTLDPRTFWLNLLVAELIKTVAVVAAMLRWHILLSGQGIRFNFLHVVGTFLIGRFLGTFLPSTLGLDAYKLYDAARFSDRTAEPAAATLVEKVLGFAGVALTFLVTLPLGYTVLGEGATLAVVLTAPVAFAVVLTAFVLLWRPRLLARLLRAVPTFGVPKAKRLALRIADSAQAYEGRAGVLGLCLFLSFLVHFGTAAMYVFTARAVGAHGADFWLVAFASSIQIFATLVSPFTLAGQGVREAVQALLLAKHLGVSQSILSAALGFWGAEVLTMSGVFVWWARGASYRPRRVEVRAAQGERTTQATG